jgi:glycosyltransferase involved in cell wall biosynthesis
MEIIHIVLGKANPSRMNGVNKVVFQLASEQAKAGKKVSVWGITKDLTHNYGERVFETCLFKAQKNPFGMSRELRDSIISKKGIATFHLHGGWVPVFYRVSSVLSKSDIPFIFTPHGAYNTIAMRRSKISKTLYFRLFEKPLLKHAHRIHCIGESEVTGLHGIFPNEKAILTPYGFKANAQTSSKDKDEKIFIIGFVGRLDIYTKGLDILLEAFESFVARDKGARLWIIGDSKERKILEQEVAQRKIQDKVVFWGSKFGKDKDELMEQMHVFVHPSRNEGLPASVLEASSMGIPCLVTKATNVGHAIRNYEAGMAVEDENKIALENGLHSLKKQWTLDRLVHMGKNARRMVNKEFNWKHIVGKFDKLYQA